ncbi:MAG TPA: hypothetical protein VFS78_14520 [Vicinamibacteria bacterium]|nr:hypothetical protein [Vicinamibacteria bacterium]
MNETRDAVLQARLEARLRAVEGELEWRQREVEELRLVRDALAREESREAVDACAGASPWFAEVLAKVWTTF